MLLYGFVKFKLNHFQETIYHFTIFNPPPPLPLAKIFWKPYGLSAKTKYTQASLYLTPFSANRRRPKTSKYFWKGHLLQNKNKTTNKQGPFHSIISIKNCKKQDPFIQQCFCYPVYCFDCSSKTFQWVSFAASNIVSRNGSLHCTVAINHDAI